MSELQSHRAELLARKIAESLPLCEIVGCLRPMFCWIDGRATCLGHTEILIDRWNAAAINIDAVEHLVPLIYR